MRNTGVFFHVNFETHAHRDLNLGALVSPQYDAADCRQDLLNLRQGQDQMRQKLTEMWALHSPWYRMQRAAARPWSV